MNMVKVVGTVAVLVAATLFLTGASSNAKKLILKEDLHIVRPGQTVWGIATKYMPQQEGTKDVRELVHDIRERNGLKLGNCTVHPGQVLVIPLQISEKQAKENL